MECERKFLKLTKDEIDRWNSTPANKKFKIMPLLAVKKPKYVGHSNLPKPAQTAISRKTPTEIKSMTTPVEYQSKIVEETKDEIILWNNVVEKNQKGKMMSAPVTGKSRLPPECGETTTPKIKAVINEKKAQQAKETRKRQNVHHMNLEKLVLDREKAVLAVKEELKKRVQWCKDIDNGNIPNECWNLLSENEGLNQKFGEDQMDQI